MDKVIPATIVIVLIVGFLALMARSWRRRKARQAELASTMPVPADPGATLATAPALYLSTTPDGEPLNRIAVRGLGFRARLGVVVTESGIILPIPGEPEVFIPKADLREISTASWTIDRGIEPEGLTVVRWTLGDTRLDSYFRFEEPALFVTAASQLVAARTSTGSDTQ
jgi:hypothetical protein